MRFITGRQHVACYALVCRCPFSAIAEVSVCPSVRHMYPAALSKPRKLKSRNLHRQLRDRL